MILGGEPPLPIPTGGPGDAGREAAEILAGDEYRPPEPSIAERVLDWIGDRLADVLPNVGATSGGRGVATVLFVIVMAALAVGLIVAVIRLAKGRRRRPRGKVTPVLYGTEVRTSADAWWDEARRLQAAGDGKGATRCYFQAAATDLVERGLVRGEPGRTASEIGHEGAAACPGVAIELDALVRAFELAWYGGIDITGDRLADVAAWATAVRTALAATPPAATAPTVAVDAVAPPAGSP